MTTKVKKVLADMADLSPVDLAELLRELGGGAVSGAVLGHFRAIAEHLPVLNDNNRRFHTGDLAALLKSTPPDPDFAADIEAGIRARREAGAARKSPWDS